MDKTQKDYAGFWDRFTPFPNVVLVDKNEKKVSRPRRVFYDIFLYAPLLIYILYATFFGQQIIEIFHYFWPTPSIIKASFYTLHFIAVIYIINWVPFFIKKYNRPFHDILFGIYVIRGEKKPFSITKLPFTIIYKLVVLFTFYLFALTIYNIPDHQLNPEVEEFFYANDFTPENNVRAVWAGLHAPAGTEDIYEYGLKVYRGEIEGGKHLEFKGEVNRNYLPGNDGKRTIPPADEINALYEDNKEIIERYTCFYDYQNYDAPSTLRGYGSGQDLITIHRFLPLYWERIVQNEQGEKAIEWWLRDMTLIQGMMGANTGLVEKAIWFIQYSIDLTALPLILKADPTLIEKYESPITALLNKNFVGEIWDIENTWRGEYSALRDMRISELPHNVLAFKPNDARNEFLEIAKDQIWLSKQPAYEIPKVRESIFAKYPYTELSSYIFPYNIGKMLLFTGFLKGSEMYTNGHAITARQRALILWIQAHKQDIPPEQMEEFLTSAPEHLYDNLTGKPFRWDAEKNAIYLERYKDDLETRNHIFY